MASPVPDSPRVRFGPFELDPSAGRLLKSGIPLKLQPQPFHVLLLLTSRPGKVVSREEIRRHLWGDSTFVDFEHGINFSINQIRAALCDNAEKPRYIETLPRVGYRFIGLLEPLNKAPDRAVNGTHDSAVHVVLPIDRTVTSKAAKRKWWRRFHLSAFWLLVGLVALASIAGVFLLRHPSQALTEKDTVVLADFDNRTGDSIFEGTLKQALAIQLDQSPFLNIFPEDGVRETLRYMGRPPTEQVTAAIAREICERRGIKAMLTGSVSSLGHNYILTLEVRDCLTGVTLAQQQAEVEGKEQVLRGLDKAASNLRAQLGESLSSIKKYDTPVEQATTTSVLALKAYSLGLKAWDVKGETAALPFFKGAVELDPKFAMAYGRLGTVYSNLGEVALGAENARKALELREKVSERERLYIESHYYQIATGELDQAAQVYELWRQIYPRDETPRGNLGYIQYQLGRYEEGSEAVRETLSIHPNSVPNYVVLAAEYIALNRVELAQNVYEEAIHRKLDSELLSAGRYELAFLKHDEGEMARLAAEATGKPGTEHVMLAMQADTEMWSGRVKNARDLTSKAVGSAQRSDAKETAAIYEAEAALREAEIGNREQASAMARSALKLSSNRDVRVLAALVAARAGHRVAAEELVAGVENDFPLDTLVQWNWLPTIGASLALDRHNPAEAIELLKMAEPFELGLPLQAATTVALVPSYVRGQAFLALHDGRAAAAEFRKLIDHRGVIVNFVLGALARLGLARAYSLSGDTAQARVAYQEFLTLWKEADPDIPILKDAKAEYAKLQ